MPCRSSGGGDVSMSEDVLDVAPVAPPELARRGKRRSILVTTMLVVAVGALLSQGLLHNLNYFETVDEAMTHLQTLGTSDFRLEGVVTPGTVQRSSSGATFYLEGQRNVREVYVIATGQPPQLFQANIPVVVAGHFEGNSKGAALIFYANQIVVKHSSTYVAQHPGRVKAPDGSSR